MKMHDETLKETPQARSVASNFEKDDDDFLLPDNSVKSGFDPQVRNQKDNKDVNN